MNAQQLDKFQAWLAKEADDARSLCGFKNTPYFDGRACAFRDAFAYLEILRMQKAPEVAVCAADELLGRIRHHLALGGCFNPELADHVAVRDLILDCRDWIEKAWMSQPTPPSATTEGQQ